MKGHFARYGIPDSIVMDNGPQFTSGRFRQFAEEWDFEVYRSSPGHQQANRMAEAAVKPANKLLRKAKADNREMNS